ncbi:MAG: adaptor protein MecA [Eubacterium sp.]|nr:adaptor protein MecA [Eubacterium sp.]
MKIEKLSENQIRCTLTREDLVSRQIRLAELAYGSDKAKKLFRDMMEEAEYTVGFSTGNSPLMIEAIPTSPESIVLIITRVDDPEELDTRFSRFTKSDEENAAPGTESQNFIGADDILDLFQKFYESRKAEASSSEAKSSPAKSSPRSSSEKKETAEPAFLVKSFRFHSLDELIRASHAVSDSYAEQNTAYILSPPEEGCRLIVHGGQCPPETFNRTCNILSEYGTAEVLPQAREAWFEEHLTVLIRDRALQQLAKLPV